MADKDLLLSSLTETRLPAIPSEREEPREPSEPREDLTPEHGRTPDEVVQPRETREAPADTPSETELPASRGSKTKPGQKTYEIRGKQYTAKQLEEAGLLEDLAITHGKHSSLQEKYQKLLEDKAKAQVEAEGKPPAETQPPAPQQITNAMIAKVYNTASDQIIADLQQNNLMESDLTEMYPVAIRTLIGQLRFAFDKIFEQEAKIAKFEAVFEAIAKQQSGQAVSSAYNKQLDDLAASDPKLYAGLRDKKIRDGFTQYLVEEVQANIGQTTGEGAPKFLAKQWVAFNAQTIVDAAKSESEKKRKQAFVMGEAGGARSGIPENTEKTLMDRMIENSGRIHA